MAWHGMLQAVASMHTQGWGHCDFKPQQVRVSLSESGKSFHGYKLVDAGSCTSFTGKHPCQPSCVCIPCVNACTASAPYLQPTLTMSASSDVWYTFSAVFSMASCSWPVNCVTTPATTMPRMSCMQLWWCAGPYNERPVHMDITPSYAAPEMLLEVLIQRGGVSCRHAIDARGQDIFSLGCFVFKQITHEDLFPLDPNETPANCLTELCRQHWLWVSSCTAVGCIRIYNTTLLFAACSSSWEC